MKRPYIYRVGAGDVLQIEAFEEPGLQRAVTVSPDGYITFPLVGSVKVVDRTLPEIQEFVRTKLLDVLTEPVVTVALTQSNSLQVQMVGEIGRQGPLAFRDRMSVVEAIGLSGGVRWPTAKTEAVRIVRGRLDRPELIEVDLDHVLWAGEPDIFLEPGDIVIVPEKYVTRLDRFITQALSPIRNLMGAAREGATAAATGGL